MRPDAATAGVPLRKSLLTRLLGASLLIAVCALSATAWLAVQTTASTIRQQSGQALRDDLTVYKTLMDYAATHPRWDGVDRTVAALARRTDRRIILRTVQDADGRTFADSSPGASSTASQALAVIDPLQADPALIPATPADRIYPQALGPFRLPAGQRQELLAAAQKALRCLRGLPFTARLTHLPGGHPRIEISGSSDDWKKGAITCPLAAVNAPTPAEAEALGRLNASIKNCLDRQGLPAVKLGLDLAPTRPLLADSASGTAAQNCVDTSRREQLAPYVAPAARLFVSESTGSAAVSGFTFSRENTMRIVGVTALVLALTTAVTVVVGLRLVRPLRALTDAARQQGRGHAPVPVTTDDEIGHLTVAFNDLSEYRERMEAQRKAMVSDIAHELRTPLTTIRGWLEATQDGMLSDEDDVTAALLEETLLLQHIIDDLQDLAASDAGTLQLHQEYLEASTILQHVATVHGGRAQAAGVAVEVCAEGDAWLFADPLRLRQVVGNLVSNAVRHTPPGGKVTLRSRRTGGTVLIEVADTGSGIGPEDLPRVFDRFWRAEQSRSRRTGGSGLGLAIVRQLVEAHKGEVTVTSTLGTGTVFALHLPT
ncbi:sensor histidine kinase [Streptomyces sp. DSM 15324]|uniref:sensor histidine kinase n=1 Tax=Streptomyces sp. DSM 15324 TaxID=1739111 RepID=UPI00082B75FD|nr:HAMP domain-containing sensor histidine kinase [Streptomyces sp. DSM 15324]